MDAAQAFGGRGDGVFVPGPVFAIQKAPQSMASGDINSDGKLDVMIAARRSLSLQAFLNVGSPGGVDNGAPCLTGDECLSNRCTNGVCCGSRCEANELCNVPGREGVCVPQSTGDAGGLRQTRATAPLLARSASTTSAATPPCDGGSCK